MFALAVTTWHNDLKLTLQFVGIRTSCERFCDALKRGLRGQMGEIKNLRVLVEGCYSEYLLGGPLGTGVKGRGSTDSTGEKEGGEGKRQPPDAGLGMVFKYPGDARKLRDRSKMRLWVEYLKGRFLGRWQMFSAVCMKQGADLGGFQTMGGMLPLFGNRRFTSLFGLVYQTYVGQILDTRSYRALANLWRNTATSWGNMGISLWFFIFTVV